MKKCKALKVAYTTLMPNLGWIVWSIINLKTFFWKTQEHSCLPLSLASSTMMICFSKDDGVRLIMLFTVRRTTDGHSLCMVITTEVEGRFLGYFKVAHLCIYIYIYILYEIEKALL